MFLITPTHLPYNVQVPSYLNSG